MYDLVCIVPLYGENCEDVSLRMVSSLALQKTSFKVKYLFYYDSTVPKKAILQIMELLSHRNIDYDILFSEMTCSGHKRNMGLEFARKNSKYVWLVDQDDYLLRDDTIQTILYLCVNNNLDVFKVSYSLPDNIGEQNIKIIRSIPTMPWQYVIKTELLDGYSFNETLEYGSDVQFSIRFLAMNEYIKIAENLTIQYLRLPPAIKSNLYFYNYLNENSYMCHHAELTEGKKIVQQQEAFSEIAKIKEEYETKHEVVNENR